MTFSLTILGSSSALPTSRRYPSACVLNVHERFFLIDCGEGTQMQLRKYRIKLGKINHIFISHLHGDHFFGLYGLISTYNLLGRKNDLHIYANKEIKNILDNHFKFFDNNLDFKIIYHFLHTEKKEIIFENKNLTVESFPLKHRIPTNGFIFKEKKRPDHLNKEKVEQYKIPIKNRVDIINGADFITGEGIIIKNSELTTPSYDPRSFAYCSDTLFDESIVKIIEGADLLLHEATFCDDKQDIAHETYHSTALEAAEIANKAKIKKLILTHFSSRYKNTDIFLKNAVKKFNEVIIAEDGLEVKINTDHSFNISMSLINS
ncbi:MAG: ribonuclease Z [Bacteroidales bacterium]|nr:ribonuclease Z [Bacteroidales bacterium]